MSIGFGQYRWLARDRSLGSESSEREWIESHAGINKTVRLQFNLLMVRHGDNLETI
jgi:hypothetical protein